MSDDPRDEYRAAQEAVAAAEAMVVAARAALDQAHAAEAEGRALLERFQTDLPREES